LHGRGFLVSLSHYAKKNGASSSLLMERFQPNLINACVFFFFFFRRIFLVLMLFVFKLNLSETVYATAGPSGKIAHTGNLKLDTQLPFLSPEKRQLTKRISLLEDKVI